jgi:hypothetical protein
LLSESWRRRSKVIRYAESRLVVASVPDLATETLQKASACLTTNAAVFFANRNVIGDGAGGADITTTSANRAGGLASSAGIYLTEE